MPGASGASVAAAVPLPAELGRVRAVLVGGRRRARRPGPPGRPRPDPRRRRRHDDRTRAARTARSPTGAERERVTARPGRGSVTTAFLGRLAARTRMQRWGRTRTVLVVARRGPRSSSAPGVGRARFVAAHGAHASRCAASPAPLAEKVAARADDQLGDPLAPRRSRRASRGGRGGARASPTSDGHAAWPHTLRVDVVAAQARRGGRVDARRLPGRRRTGVVLSTVDDAVRTAAARRRRRRARRRERRTDGPRRPACGARRGPRAGPAGRRAFGAGHPARPRPGATRCAGGARTTARARRRSSPRCSGRRRRVYDVSAPDLPTTRSERLDARVRHGSHRSLRRPVDAPRGRPPTFLLTRRLT